MAKIEFLDDVTVELVDFMGNDRRVVQAAQVSVVGKNDPENFARDEGLINYLSGARHGSPFEHIVMTYYIEAPIFVFREFMRHRIASYNEMSARYKELPPRFYIPNERRNLVQAGKSSHPDLVPGTDEQYNIMRWSQEHVANVTWENYRDQLDAGIALEVARNVLPVNIMSQMYVTMNARSLMNFFSLRVDSDEAVYPSKPQKEIEMVALKMEKIFAEKYPLVHNAFLKTGRVSP